MEVEVMEVDHCNKTTDPNCAICGFNLDGNNDITLGEKGAQGIMTAARSRGNPIVILKGMTVHARCRKTFTDKRFFGKDLTNEKKSPGRPSNTSFECIDEDIPFKVKRRRSSGRPQNESQFTAFLKTCSFLESKDDEQISLTALIGVMDNFLKDTEEEAYSKKFMKERLQEHFGDRIHITSVQGISTVVTLRETAEKILHNYYGHPKEINTDLQKRLIIEAAAKIIQSDFKAETCVNNDFYPNSQDLTLEKSLAYIPECLLLFCKTLFVGADSDRKVASIGQALMQAVRPRTTSPISFTVSY